MARKNDKKKEELCLAAWHAQLPANSIAARQSTGCDARTISKYYKLFDLQKEQRQARLGVSCDITPQVIQQEALELVYVRLQAHKLVISRLEQQMHECPNMAIEELVSIANITKLNIRELRS